MTKIITTDLFNVNNVTVTQFSEKKCIIQGIINVTILFTPQSLFHGLFR